MDYEEGRRRILANTSREEKNYTRRIQYDSSNTAVTLMQIRIIMRTNTLKGVFFMEKNERREI